MGRINEITDLLGDMAASAMGKDMPVVWSFTPAA